MIKGICNICGITINRRRMYCNEHNPQLRDWNNITLGELQDRCNDTQISARVRQLARQAYITGNDKCEQCGYDTRVHIHHIQPISEHKPTDTIDYVNRPDNIMILCPNCHGEQHMIKEQTVIDPDIIYHINCSLYNIGRTKNHYYYYRFNNKTYQGSCRTQDIPEAESYVHKSFIKRFGVSVQFTFKHNMITINTPEQ